MIKNRSFDLKNHRHQIFIVNKNKMKNLIKVLSLFLFLSLVNSCAMHQGYINNSVALEQNNFDYVNTNISGMASAVYIVGIGGLDRDAIVNAAKQDMLRQNPLKSNQGLANLTVNWKNTWLIVYTKTTCTVSADVVEFNK